MSVSKQSKKRSRKHNNDFALNFSESYDYLKRQKNASLGPYDAPRSLSREEKTDLGRQIFDIVNPPRPRTSNRKRKTEDNFFTYFDKFGSTMNQLQSARSGELGKRRNAFNIMHPKSIHTQSRSHPIMRSRSRSRSRSKSRSAPSRMSSLKADILIATAQLVEKAAPPNTADKIRRLEEQIAKVTQKILKLSKRKEREVVVVDVEIVEDDDVEIVEDDDVEIVEDDLIFVDEKTKRTYAERIQEAFEAAKKYLREENGQPSSNYKYAFEEDEVGRWDNLKYIPNTQAAVDKLSKSVPSLNRHIVKSGADGHCFYHSIKPALKEFARYHKLGYMGKKFTSASLSRAVHAFMETLISSPDVLYEIDPVIGMSYYSIIILPLEVWLSPTDPDYLPNFKNIKNPFADDALWKTYERDLGYTFNKNGVGFLLEKLQKANEALAMNGLASKSASLTVLYKILKLYLEVSKTTNMWVGELEIVMIKLMFPEIRFVIYRVVENRGMDTIISADGEEVPTKANPERNLNDSVIRVLYYSNHYSKLPSSFPWKK